jgi:hypothetical protein
MPPGVPMFLKKKLRKFRQALRSANFPADSRRFSRRCSQNLRESANICGKKDTLNFYKKFGSFIIFVVVMFTKLILLYISLGEAITFVANSAYTIHTASERRNICLFYAHKQTNVPPLRGGRGNTSDFFYKGYRLSEANA